MSLQELLLKNEKVQKHLTSFNKLIIEIKKKTDPSNADHRGESVTIYCGGKSVTLKSNNCKQLLTVLTEMYAQETAEAEPLQRQISCIEEMLANTSKVK